MAANCSANHYTSLNKYVKNEGAKISKLFPINLKMIIFVLFYILYYFILSIIFGLNSLQNNNKNASFISGDRLGRPS